MRLLAFLSLFCLLFTGSVTANDYGCVACTALLGIVEEQAMLQGSNITGTLNVICDDISTNGLFDWLCDHLLDKYAPVIESDFKQGIPPDATCIKFNACNKPQCKLWSTWPPQREETIRTEPFNIQPPTEAPVEPELKGDEWLQANPERKTLDETRGIHSIGVLLGPVFRAVAKATESLADPEFPYKEKFQLIRRPDPLTVAAAKLQGIKLNFPEPLQEKGVGAHLPELDLDGDAFSTITGLRGTDWRGKDCNDLDKSIYPGRLQTSHPASVDHNCNGIAGNDANGQSYEQLFCSGTQQYGLIAMGDSATAHFVLPAAWFTAPFTNTTFKNVIPVVTDEVDWPQCSWSTAHVNDSSRCPTVLGPELTIQSVYSHFRSRNLCSHRDYQNIAMNGADSVNTAPPSLIIEAFRRSISDQPAIVLYSLIGNDVCNNVGLSKMTPPDVFYNSTMKSLHYLDSVLPPNSIVVTTGLVDGRILYEAVSHHIHPLGVKYPVFYDFLNCLGVSPCMGWMNTNSTLRNLTTAHAQLLNQQYKLIEQTETFTNFKLRYFYFDVQSMLNHWISQGNDPLDLIARVDGFHPSQTGNMFWQSMFMTFLNNEFPEALPPINPMNQQIIQQFGPELNGY